MSERIKFIINTSVEFFNATYNQDDSIIREFFDNDEITVLAAIKHENQIQFYYKIPTEENLCLLFYKIPQVSGTKSNDNNNPTLGLLTLEGGMVKSIYNSVSRVFSPHGNRRNEYSPELSGLLENLHVSLGSTLGLSQTGINNIQDEINFWNQKSLNSSTKSDREQAQLFADYLDKINKKLRQIEQNSLNTMEEFLDSAHNNLDEIWRLPYHYPQNRMADLMDVICNQIIEICTENLITEDIWNLNSYHVNNLINHIIDIIDSLIQLCDSLTRLFWPNYGQHSWIGKPHIPQKGKLYKERLLEIKNIKNLYKQICTLLNEQDMKNLLQWNNSPFKDINIFDVSSIGQNKWNKTLNKFEQLLQPIDEKIALAIKYQLYNHLSNPRQVIFIFSKYDTLIQRPTVLELLTIEREQFLQSLHILMKDLRKAMNDTNMEPDTDHLSTICNECRWLKVVQYQIYEIEKVIHLINGRDGFDEVNKSLQDLKEETETLLKTNFEIWTEQSINALKSGDLRLREDQSVVEFEKEGRQLMRVTFNPKLVTFCQDVREFENLGYRVPIELRSSANHAVKFMSYARRLQQIATFHNTIGDRMIPCQRPIMLRNAVELSKFVQSESVAWNDEESVQRYVATLQEAVAKLSEDNNLLVGYHEQAKRTVIKLMNTDLLTQSQSWKDEMRHLRELVATLESQGYTNLDAFKLHWDHQLYKVLEYQYISGLIDMNNKLPDIQIDIVFRQRQLQFRPPEEEIRSRYFTQLKRFIERPLGFRGLSDKSKELFKVMIERNRHHFGSLFKKAEELFQKLEELKNLWIPWVALGCVDIDELCSTHLTKWQHWDANFKACKYFGQQIAKIQNSEETIDCFVINILPLRSDIEFISRRYWEALANSLRTSILNDISIIQEFLQSSFQFLQNVPMDETEIAESGAKYEKIKSEMPNILKTLEEVKGKDNCLAGWCKERVSTLSGIIIQWEKLQPLIDNHSAILQRQVDIMKDHITSQSMNLQNEAEKFALRWESTIMELESNEDVIDLTLFKERQQNWKLIQERQEKLYEDANKFNMKIPDNVLELFKDIGDKVSIQAKQWQIFDEFTNELENVLNEEWTVYRKRPYILTEFLSKWDNSVTSSSDLISSKIHKIIDQYQTALPVLQHLQSEALTEKHWAKIFQFLKKQPKPTHVILLKDVMDDANLLISNSNEIQNLVRQASSEQIVRQALGELDQWSVTAVLKLTTHTDSNGKSVPLIKDFQEILNKIGDNQSLLQSAKNSAAFETFSDQSEIWEGRLNTLDDILSRLTRSQRKWVYLEPIFGAGTLRSEEALFKRIDNDFRYIMREIQNDPRVLSILKISNIKNMINSIENQLTRCQNTLISYITEKRNSFPRFYFLGDDDLLEILGQASKEEIIQKHIKKLFPGVHSLFIQKSEMYNAIQKIRSAEGDVVTLSNPVQMIGPIEDWLSQLVISIQNTLKEQIKQCSNSSQLLTQDIIEKYPIQVTCTTLAINFTKQTEKAIASMSLSSVHKNLKENITRYTEIKNKCKDYLIQLKLRGILLDLVHYVTIVEFLIEKNVTNLDDWHWLQQMKFYLNNNGHVVIKMVFAEFDYSYEFLGNPNKLVHTSLTHKCYLTLTQAINMGLGGNPFGPAGTGKTECVKALGGMMGRLVLVFNCDKNVDIEAMGLILTGLARCGAWGCFDEFNRLQETTLSAISMIIQPIQIALKEKHETVEILEKSIKLNHHCGIFVTLNPAGEEYKGRQQLPGNIQALFRPIVMKRPEPKEIARVMLFVEGFKDANKIGDRIVELFNLTEKMLSTQKHYDWGLRELTTILLACGKQLRENTSEVNEMKIVTQTLRANTMSKLTTNDCHKFDALLKNVFPEIEYQMESNSKLYDYIQESFSTLGLYPNNRQIEKCLQLYEQLIKRMGVVVIGPPCSGKTTIISLLKQALIISGKTIRSYMINPKSMNRIQLLGKLDTDTRQWTDGVLTATAVTVNSEPININSWIICDGDIDPEWIEALNSVLDDNKLLTLPSGWRIQFSDNINFIFETHDLSYASPATISRMGIVNMSSEDLKEDIIIEAFLNNNDNSELLRLYIEEHLNIAINLIYKEKLSFIGISNICLVKSVLKNLSNIKNRDHFCTNLIQSLIGFIIDYSEQNKFANKILELANIYIPNPLKAEFIYFNEIHDTIEIYQNSEHHYNIDAVSNESSELLRMNNESMPEINLILTEQIQFYLDILRKFLTNSSNTPFIIIGPSGSGKSLLIEFVVNELTGYQLITLKCSTQLTPNYILHFLKQNCVTISGNRGREYKPQKLKIILFLKDVDLCLIDSWGTSSVIEFLRQLIQRNGFYSDNLEWINISGLQVCATISNMNRQKLSSRYLSINDYLNIRYPSEIDMKIILQNHLQPIMKKFKKIQNSSRLVDNLIEFFNQIQETFTVQNQIHYSFTPKMLMNAIRRFVNYMEEYFNDAIITEINSTFRNRLVTRGDIEQYDNILRETIGIIKSENLYFIPKTSQSSLLYCTSLEEWKETVQKAIAICNSESLWIDGPVTDELLYLTATILRYLSLPKTHVLLIGRPGYRRTDSLYLASVIGSSKIYIPQGIKNYSLNDFYSDLKLAMQSSALENLSTILLIDHSLLVFLPEIMKPIEAILQGSEIIDLFGDDLESIASPLKSAAQLEGYQESLSSYFLKRVQTNLHLVINVDAAATNLDELFNTYSSLYRNTEIVWLPYPSSETILSLPKQIIQTLAEETDAIPIPSYFANAVNLQLEHRNVIPQKFYWLIKSYCTIYSTFKENIMKQLHKLKMGIEKLAEAHKIVATLKQNAIQQEEALANKRKLANEALEMISSTMRNANDQKSDLLELKRKTQENSEILKERKKVIEKELQEVEPILREASAAVGQIKSEALSEIRSLRAPPETIRDILEGVLRLMGIRDTSWNSMKSFLAKRGVKEDIRSLDPARISPENCEAVEKLLQTKSDSFDVRNAKRASAAAAPLATWVIANVKYSKVIQSIKPLEREQNDLQRNLEMAESQMRSLMSGLDDVDERVKQLSGQLNVYTQEAAVLELKLEEARSTLKSSEVLVEKLSTEFQSWNKKMENYNETFKTLDVKSFLISLALNYYSDLTHENRKSIINSFVQNIGLKEFNLSNNLTTEQDEIIWESMGLNRDAQAIENAALLLKMIEIPFTYCAIPLVIDPSRTVISWLHEYLQSNRKSFDVISQNSEKLPYTLELCVRFGKILIVTDCHDIRPPIMQILYGRINCKFNKKQIQIGSKIIDLHDDFRLILCSKLTKLDIDSELISYLNKIYFTVTASGLTDQLLSKTILLKKPDLEQKRIQLLKDEGNLLKERSRLEDRLLEELSNAQGDILKNDKLLQTLNEVKQSSIQIDESLKNSTQIKKSLLHEFEQFKKLCYMVSNFYMGLILMYTVSVQTFINLFMKILKNSVNIDENKMYKDLVKSTFQYISRSIPKNDHVTLGVFICKCAFSEQVPSIEWEMFVTNFMNNADDTLKFPLPKWIKKEQIPKILTLMSNLPDLYRNLQFENENLWIPFIESRDNEKRIPIAVSAFQKILLSQIFRPDYMLKYIIEMIYALTDIKITSLSQPSIETLVEESSENNPILIVTESGIDPSDEIKNLSLKKFGKNMYMEFSIGKGMEKLGLENIKKSSTIGKWICIKNAHLIPNWLIEINHELDNMKIHKNFRLWIICDSIKEFSESFLCKCIKILYELPIGLKNKTRYLMQQSNSILTESTNKDAKLIKLYIVTFILNSILLERRNFIPQGWSKWYEFGESDLRSALQLLNWMEASIKLSKIDWLIIQGLYENVAYGGRIDNIYDVRILKKHLEEFFNEKVLNNKWKPLNFKMNIPTTKNIQDYYDSIYKFPDTDTPEIFGLSPLSNISKDITHCKNIVKTLRNVSFQDGEQSNLEKRIRPILGVWKKLASNIIITKIYDDLHETPSQTVWQSFIISEIRIANTLFRVIHSDLVYLHSIIKETNSCSTEDKLMLKILSENKVPINWKKIWSGPQTAIEYIKNFIHKCFEIEKQYHNNFNDEFIDNIDLSHIFNPQAFLSAFKIICSNELMISTTDLEINSSTISGTGKNIIKISPLMTDGGSFKNDKLVIFNDDKDLDKFSPEFYITFMEKQQKKIKKLSENFVEIPVYTNVDRNTFVCTLSVLTNGNSDNIILSGAALIIPAIT